MTATKRKRNPNRRERRNYLVEDLYEVVGQFEEVMGSLELIEDEEGYTSSLVPLLKKLPVDLEYGEAESLLDELQSWFDNLPENLSSSEKASQLEEAISYLENAISYFEEFEEIDIPNSYKEFLKQMEEDSIRDSLESARESIQNGIDELESIEFPGMFR